MMFGMVLSESMVKNEETGKMEKKTGKIKTRDGASVKLSELLNEARDRALKNFEERNKTAEEKV